MLSKLINRVKFAFAPVSPQDSLDAFIQSKNPTTVCEVEYWIKVYDREQYSNRSANFYLGQN